MAWYRTGTVNVTNGSTTVTGVGTTWISSAKVGESFLGPDGQIYEITNVNSSTSLTVTPAYKGPTSSAQGYALMPTRGDLSELVSNTAALVSSYAGIRDGAGKGKFDVGTLAAPSVRGAADENTGIRFAGNDVLQLITNGVARLQISADGTPTGVFTEKLPVSTATQAALNELALLGVKLSDVGAAPNQLPSNQHLGKLAFSDTVGVTSLLQHTPDAVPGTTWKQVDGTSFAEKFVRPDGEVVDVTPLKLMQGFGLGQAQLGDVVAGFPKSYPSAGGNTTPTRFIASGQSDPQADSHAPLASQEFGGVHSSRLLRPIQMGVSGRGQGAALWYRGFSGPVSDLADWKRAADINSPAFTGTPSAPNLKLGNVASADANTLDHYEEGTFTPTIFGSVAAGTNTYIAGNGGNYTRIGNRVFWTAWVGLATTSGMDGLVRVGGLPYIVRNGARYRGGVSFGQVAGLPDTAMYTLSAYHSFNSSNIEFLKRVTGQTSYSGLAVADFPAGAQVYMSGHYEVA